MNEVVLGGPHRSTGLLLLGETRLRSCARNWTPGRNSTAAATATLVAIRGRHVEDVAHVTARAGVELQHAHLERTAVAVRAGEQVDRSVWLRLIESSVRSEAASVATPNEADPLADRPPSSEL